MPYPESPFGDDFDAGILVRRADDDETNVSEIQIGEVTKWLCQAPKITSFRVNTLKADVGEAHRWIRAHIAGAGLDLRVERHPSCADAVIVHHPVSHQTPQKHNKEIVVDAVCGAAVLRGAHIYAPGVIGMMSNIQIGDNVSIYVDLDKKCKKGFLKLYNGKKTFIGNGEVILGRNHLFCETPQTGLAIKMIETISSCPPVLGDNFLPPGAALLQNLPSIICTHVLAPCPNDTILDMCASPGNKTTHIAALLKNQGRLVAIDKTPTKVAQLRQRCENFGAKVEILQTDSTKLLDRFCYESFDKILLDAPCSALGKRPQFVNTTSRKILRSYVPLQRKLFETAVQLLKTDGTLVYSTCTITLAENEGIVAWALKNFKLELVEAAPILGGPGWDGTQLTSEQLKKVQRFGPHQSIDSVGFFIAKFVKK
ncbi:tRNA (cytosine(72)-C(5))-methyltransferase NSUN6 isoform X2 [Tribolium castaneum]|uniref:Methyltransferase NSUN6-like Protein n=1 Tax=Tribolium castaneum TaxID=7070 RepID=D6WZC9_TRICA|nr:PREDICTED: putative methyltransferase NSUN6 isoform X2 [Tribolium castaneum]EFA09726.1 Putative methyltransferase NSUN6-like Protein [Tribolium castaneum]|eukprot:XP_015839204.1 PREDICTED: putative methyltransferase NSUN6 isoform X2 [Tribolium castaneum]